MYYTIKQAIKFMEMAEKVTDDTRWEGLRYFRLVGAIADLFALCWMTQETNLDENCFHLLGLGDIELRKSAYGSG